MSKNLFEHNKLGYNFSSWGRGKVWSLRLPVTQEVAGSNPVVPAKGQIAQSVEHLSEKQGVGSSILASGHKSLIYHLKKKNNKHFYII